MPEKLEGHVNNSTFTIVSQARNQLQCSVFSIKYQTHASKKTPLLGFCNSNNLVMFICFLPGRSYQCVRNGRRLRGYKLVLFLPACLRKSALSVLPKLLYSRIILQLAEKALATLDRVLCRQNLTLVSLIKLELPFVYYRLTESHICDGSFSLGEAKWQQSRWWIIYDLCICGKTHCYLYSADMKPDSRDHEYLFIFFFDK